MRVISGITVTVQVHDNKGSPIATFELYENESLTGPIDRAKKWLLEEADDA